MIKSFARVALAVGMSFGVTGGALSASMEALQGAWTMNGTQCDSTFKKVGGKIQFIDRDAPTTTGLIVSGNNILGANTTCTAEKVRAGKEHFSAYLNCSDSIMFSNVTVSFKVIDSTHFQRFDAEFPEAAVIYQKCDM